MQRYSEEKRQAYYTWNNAVRKIAVSLVGGTAAYRGLGKDARLAVREHAKTLHSTGQDYTASQRRLQDSPEGFVYIISNPAWSALKIGMAVEPHGRLKGYQTSSPLRDYKLEDYVYVTDRRKAEKELHDWLGTRRLSNEWFDVPLGEARMVLALIKDFYRPNLNQLEEKHGEEHNEHAPEYASG